MTDEYLEFDKWWKDYFSGGRFGSGNEELEYLKPAVAAFSTDRQIAFIDELLNRNYFYFASAFIPLYGIDNQKQLIRDKLSEWINSNDNNSNGSDLIRVVLKTYKTSDFDLIKRYFLEQRTIWFSIPTELFHVDKAMFLSAFKKLLPTFNDIILYERETLTYLIYDLNALEFLIDKMPTKESNRIKKVCLIKSQNPFYSDEIRNQLLKLSNK